MRTTDHIVDVTPISRADVATVHDILVGSWDSTVVAAHGTTYDAATLPGFLARLDGAPAGLLTYHVQGDDWEIVTIDAIVERRGVGSGLLAAAEAAARLAGAHRLWLITTNDNVHALRFYQRRGFDLVTVHHDAVTRARATLKPSIPLVADGIPIRHELELERLLG